MAKINPIFGKFQGKLGGTVFAIRNGEQILREYNPSPANPNTLAQIEARAKLKLMSQLSAVFAPVIAMRREGAVSSRNLFVKANYGATTYSADQADITLTAVKLTKSVVNLPTISATAEGGTVTVKLQSSVVAPAISRVVYACFLKMQDNTLRYKGSQVVSDGGVDNDWPALFYGIDASAVIFAYGVRDNTEAARVLFGDMQVVTAETVAKVIVSRTLTESDVTLTETKAVAYTPQA